MDKSYIDPELEEKINLLIDERNRKNRIKNRISYIEEILPSYERELAVLSQILSKEEQDYLKIRRNSVLTLLTKLYKDYEKLLDKEYQEYVIAYATYFDQLKQIENLKSERNILRLTLSGLFNVDKELKELLKIKENLLMRINPEFSKRVREYERRINSRKLFISELHQADRAGKVAFVKVKRLLGGMNDLIKQIQKYGFLTPMPFQMRSQLMELHRNITPTIESLDSYSAELRDVSKKYRISYQDELHDLQRFLKHLVSRLIIDFVQRNELSSTRSLLKDLLNESEVLQQTIQNEVIQTERLLDEDRIALQEIATEF